jgi:hypothetical protein
LATFNIKKKKFNSDSLYAFMVRTVVVIIFVCPGPCFSRIGDVMVSVLAPSTVDGGYEIGISCFPAKHAALRRKIKDGLARNHDNVSEWGDMSIRGLLFQ